MDMSYFTSMKLKFDVKRLFLWFLIYYAIHNPLREILLYGKTDFFDFFISFHSLVLTFTGLLSSFTFSLLSYASFYYFFRHKRWLYFGLSILFIFTVPIAIRYFLEEILIEVVFGFDNYDDRYTALMYYRDNFYFFFQYMIVGVVYYIYQFGNHKEIRQNQLESANQRMELDLLKSQTNPHFLLNALNNIYSLVYHKSEDALGAIDNLSSILKYALYDNRQKVLLSEELSFVDKYIQLQKLRVDHSVEYKMDIDNSIRNVLIPQFLLVPIIENIFKHGDLKSNPAFELRIYKQDSRIIIYSQNKVSHHEKDGQGGIGIKNLRKRLQLLYADDATMEVNSTHVSFDINIALPYE